MHGGASLEAAGKNGSPFAHLKTSPVGCLWRTQSLDEGQGSRSANTSNEHEENDDGGIPAVTIALNQSFDVAFLESCRGQKESSIFRTHTEKCDLEDDFGMRTDYSSPASPWDDYDSTGVHGMHSTLGELSGRKRTETAERGQPGTVRKLPRRSSTDKTPQKKQLSAFPLSLTAKKTTGIGTPSSFAKRYQRAPLTVKKSGQRPPQATHTPTRPKSSIFPNTAIKRSTRTQVTLETTITGDSDSHGTSSPASTPFRFSSFPASLPRVNNARTGSPFDSRRPPDSIRKRMVFVGGNQQSGESDGCARIMTNHPLHLLPTPTRDDECTQNTSISSMSQDGHQHMPCVAAPSVPPTVLEWTGPVDGSINNDITTEHEGEDECTSPVHTKLFMQEDNNYVYSEDNSIESPNDVTVGRTRLNFNLLLSPNQDGGEQQQKGTIIPKTIEKAKGLYMKTGFPYSDDTPLRNISVASETFTPSRPGLTNGSIVTGQGTDGSRTPDHVQIHFNVDAALCSPILGILEGDEALRSFHSRRDSSQEEKMPPSNLDTDQSLSQECGNSSTTSSKLRKLRPMPDISAFDTATSRSASSSKQQDKSSDESTSGFDLRVPPSPKLLCPPTPVRTPAWAHNESKATPLFARQNSLIVTKVLAQCPPQVLDGHSSLESSLFEDDSVSESAECWRRASLSFGVPDEDMEEASTSVVNGVSSKKNGSAINCSTNFTTDAGMAASSGPTIEVDTSFEQAKAVRRNRLSAGSGQVGSVISFATDFENLGLLGRGSFADVYTARSKLDNQRYAIKKNRIRFRGKRDRDMALAEVRTMQRLQSVCAESLQHSVGSKSMEKNKHSYSLYLLFFFRAWQEEGYFHSQTELCCRESCREMMESLRAHWNFAKRKYPSLLRNLPLIPAARAGSSNEDSSGRLVPETTVWKISHDVVAGLSHIHSHGIVHYDIKPSNIFFVPHHRLGAMCKIGDFGMAGDAGTTEDGHEGDTIYMPPELLSSGVKRSSADMFSLGLTLYELASSASWNLPSEGSLWHEVRSGTHVPVLPQCRSPELGQLVQAMISPDPTKRPTADKILQSVVAVKKAGARCDEFLRDYINDIDEFDRTRSVERRSSGFIGDTPRNDADEFSRRTPTPEQFTTQFTTPSQR